MAPKTFIAEYSGRMTHFRVEQLVPTVLSDTGSFLADSR